MISARFIEDAPLKVCKRGVSGRAATARPTCRSPRQPTHLRSGNARWGQLFDELGWSFRNAVRGHRTGLCSPWSIPSWLPTWA